MEFCVFFQAHTLSRMCRYDIPPPPYSKKAISSVRKEKEATRVIRFRGSEQKQINIAGKNRISQ